MFMGGERGGPAGSVVAIAKGGTPFPSLSGSFRDRRGENARLKVISLKDLFHGRHMKCKNTDTCWGFPTESFHINIT
jgi:hypothetical protein